MSNLYLYILHVVRAPCCCSDQIRPIRPTAVVWGGRARVTQTKCQPAGNVQVITEQAPLPPHSQGAIFYFYWNIYLPILITKHFLIILDSLIKKYFLVFGLTSCNISCVRSDPHIPPYLVTSLSLSVEQTWPDLSRAMTFQLGSGKISPSHPVT